MPVMPMTEPDPEAWLFAEALHVDGPARLHLHDPPLPEGAREAALQVLAAIAVVEDRRGDDGGPASDTGLAIRRLEAKLDLTLLLLARLLPELQVPSPREARLGVRGLRLDGPVPAGPAAVLHWQPADWLPVTVQLPLRRMGAAGGSSWWAFETLGGGLEDALERHIFRLHRRWRAGQRAG
jgi:hypothetical protein